MTEPLVSVVIPTYNRGEELKDAVESALGQSHEPIEVIVVDDHSDTPASEALADAEDERLTILRHDQNRNGAAARNTGIEEAAGDYIAFLDDDDSWHEEKIEKQVKELQARPDEFRACYTYLEYILDGETETIGEPYTGDIRKELLLRKVNGGFGSSLMVAADIVDAVGGFDEQFDRHQDWEFLLNVLEHCKITVIEEPLVTIEGEYGLTDGAVLQEAKELLLEKYSEYIQGLGWRARRKIYSTHHLELAQSYAYNGDRLQGLVFLGKSLWKWPIIDPRELARTLFYMTPQGGS